MTARRIRALPRDPEGYPLAAGLEKVAQSVGRPAEVLLSNGLGVLDLAGRQVVHEVALRDYAEEIAARAEADAAHNRDGSA